jgi:hypothetical protein
VWEGEKASTKELEYTEEMKRFIKSEGSKNPWKDVTRRFNEKFGQERTPSGIQTMAGRLRKKTKG